MHTHRVGQKLADRYLLLRPIGSGGAGDVFAALDLQLNRQVAIKLVRLPDDGVENIHTFATNAAIVHEAQTQAQLAHPNVVAIFDVGRDGDQLFLAMELITGSNLRTWLGKKSHGWRDAVGIFISCASGLHAAHERSIFHRDFKPENVLVDAKGRAFVMDFGIALTQAVTRPFERSTARAPGGLTAGLTEAFTELSGTPGYLAPEYVDEGRFDARADQFSFGVALYESLCGTRPFPTLVAGTAAKQVDQVIKTHRRPRQVPSWLWRIVERTLQANPTQRFSSLSEVADALTRGMSSSARVRRWLAIGAPLAMILGLSPAIPDINDNRCEQRSLAQHAEWTQELASHIEAVFRKQGDDGTAFQLVNTKLAEHTRSIAQSYMQLCEINKVASEHLSSREAMQSDAIARCLRQSVALYQGFLAELQQADRQVVREAPRAAMSLEEPQQCLKTQRSEDRRLREQELALDAEQLKKIDSLREHVHELEGRAELAQSSEILARIPELLQAAHDAPSDVLRAEIYAFAGTRNMRANLAHDASSLLHRGLYFAQSTDHARVEISALSRLVRLHGYQLQQHDVAHDIAAQLKAVYQRAGSPPLLGIEMESELGTAAAGESDFVRALWHYQRSLDLALSELPLGHPRRATQYVNVAFAQIYLGNSAAAQELLYRGLDAAKHSLADSHPHLVLMHHNLAVTNYNLGNTQGAIEHALQSQSLCQKGETDPLQCSSTVAILSEFLVDSGRFDESIAYLRELAKHQEAAGRRGPAHAYWAHESLASRLIDRGDLVEARAITDRGLQLVQRESQAPRDFAAGLTLTDLVLRDRLGERPPSDEEILATVARFRGHTLYGIHSEARILELAADLFLQRNNPREAQRLLLAMIAEFAPEVSSENRRLRAARLALIATKRELGQLTDAIKDWESGEYHFDVSAPGGCQTNLWLVGESSRLWLARGRPEQALVLSDAAIACLHEHGDETARASEYALLSATALAAMGPTYRERAIELSRLALHFYQAHPGFAREVAKAETLLLTLIN